MTIILSSSNDGRIYNDYPGSQYTLPADEKERQRLNLQHYIWKHICGDKNIVAPIKESDFQPGDKILDSGAGTGIWSLEVGQSVPEGVSVHGIDISPHLLPRSPPNNLHYSLQELSNLPESWSNSFKLVHQRLLFMALTQAEWSACLKSIFRILAPGGWVQLLELDIRDRAVGPASQMQNDILYGLGKQRGIWVDCVDHLDSSLAEQGFVNVQRIDFTAGVGDWAGEDGKMLAQVTTASAEGFRRATIMGGGLGVLEPTEEAYDKFMQDLRRERREIPGAKYTIRAFIGQKPL